MSNEQLFIKACRKEKIDRTPIWLMRQTGGYLPQYKEIRAKYDFLTMCKTPEIACEITLQPVDILGVDSAIIFSDILLLPEAMGMNLFMNEGGGPQFENPIETEKDIDKLIIPDPSDKLEYVLNTINITRKCLDKNISLIGFSASPWLLFAYMVEGGSTKDFKIAKTFMYSEPMLAHKLIEKIARAVSLYLIAQIEAGADAVQIFDSWAGVLGYDELKEFSLEYIEIVIKSIKSKFGNKVPIILYSKGTSAYTNDLVKTGCDVLSIDWTFDIGKTRELFGDKVAIQGNLDPIVLLSKPEAIISSIDRILEKYGKGEGHIFNLGYGILHDTPVENVKLLIDTVKTESKKYH